MELEKANSYLQKTVELKSNIERSFLLLGERLKRIRDEKIYLPAYEAFWCFTEEQLKMSESTASRLISVYQKFILDWKVSPEKVIDIGGWNEAYLICKQAKNKDEAEELLEKYALMPPSEIRKEVASLKVGEHKHDWYELHIRQCRVCGLKEQIQNEK